MESVTLKDIEKSFEKSWERIVNILGEIFNTKVALINEIDGSKIKILKAGGSYEKYFSENDVFDLVGAYCGEVAKNKEMLEINNAEKEEKWKGTPNLETGLISYLGYPIFNSRNKIVGTICVEDNKERNFNQTEKKLLLEFKEVIEHQLQQINLTKRLEDNLEKGRKLHKQTLPSKMPDINELSFGTFYQAADRLGGDFYDLIELKDNLLFYISDVTGHDLSSSMLNIFLKEAVNSYLLYQHDYPNYLSPAKIINYINERFIEKDFPADYFIALIIGIISLDNFQITLSNAGFQFSPLISKKNGKVTAINCKGMPITITKDYINYQECQHYLKPKETLYITTDGLYEQQNNSGDMYGEKRVVKTISRYAHLNPEIIVDKIYKDFLDYKKNMPIQDDLTSLLIQHN